MAPYRPADGRGLFDLGKRGRAIAPVLVLLLMVLDGLPAAGAAHAAPPALAVGGTVASPIVTHLPSPAVSNGASPLCRTTSGCASTPAAPHPAAAPPPRWTDLQSKVTNQVPAHRYLGSMAYDPLDGYVVLFGGFGNGSSAPYGDTWSYSNGRWNEISPSGPQARYAAMMAWDAADNYILLFGGYDSSTGQILNDTWSFVHGTWNQLNPPSSPPARWRGAMAFDIADNYTVLFGGTPDTGTLSPLKDTWTFNAGVWTDQSTKVSGNPAAKFRQEMAYDAADGYAVMFGGCTTSGCTGTDTWTYSNLTWKQLSLTVKPTARAYEGITYDAAQGYVLMYAGDDYTTNVAKTDTWEFLGGNWTDLSGQFTTYPSTRAFEMLAYDGADGYSLLFGGQNPSSATFLNDTWAYGPSVIGHFVASPTTIDLSQAVSFNATPFAFAGYANYTYSNLPPGCVGGNVSVITCTPTATGLFDVSVSINDSLGFPTVKDAVVAVNEPLAITGITAAPSTVTAGTRFHVNVTAGNGTLPFAYSYTGLPAGCSSANTASLGCTPTGTGSFTIFGNVVDATGFFTSVHIGVTVNPQPSLPALVAAPSTIDLGEHFTLWANATGGTAPLTYVYSGLPIGCSSVDGPTMGCTPTATGAGTVHVNVTDLFGWSASASLTVTVNPAPSITGFAVSPGTIDLGGKVTFWLNATGGTGALSVQYAGMPVGCNLGRQTTGQCTPTENGSFTITGTATDARGISVVQQVTLLIVTDPSIDSVTPTPTLVDVGQNVTISTVVSGGTNPISYTYTGLPTGCTNTSSANVVCRPRTSGQFTIVAQITDAWGMTSQLSTLLEVSAAPSISGFTATVSPVTVGSSTTLQVTVTGGTGPFTYVYTNLPAGCTSANKSSLVCAPSAAGTFNVTVKVTDRLGVSVTSSTQFEVDAASSSSGILGLSGSTGYLVIALIVIVIVVALAAVMMMRRRRPPAQPAEEWAESPAEETPT